MNTLINISAFLLMTLVISRKTQRGFVTAIPTVWCILMVTLLPLAYVNALPVIDYLSAFVVICLGIYLIRSKAGFRQVVKEAITQPATIVFLLSLGLVVLLNINAVICSWDDINYWATTVRSFFIHNGLEARYCNVASGWGDYPVGQQLIEWWFMHTFGNEWRENLLFIGYYTLLISFAVPFFEKLSRKFFHILLSAVFCVAFILVHVCYETVHNLNADLIMSVMYAGCIINILQVLSAAEASRNNADIFSLMFQLAGITMIKSVGFLWSVFAVILYYTLRPVSLSEKNQIIRKPFKMDWCLPLMAIAVYVFWAYICHERVRSTYLTQALQNASYNSFDRHFSQAVAFLKALIVLPAVKLKIGKTVVSLSLMTLIVLPYLFLCVIPFIRTVPRRFYQRLCLHTAGATCLYLLILLYSYETMFLSEFSADAELMIDSLTRYVLPCIVTPRAVLAYTYLSFPKRNARYRGIGVLVAVVLLLSVNSGTLLTSVRYALEGYQEVQYERSYYEDKYSALYQQLAVFDGPSDTAIHWYGPEISAYDEIYLEHLAPGFCIDYYKQISPDSIAWFVQNDYATHVFVSPYTSYTEQDFQYLMEEGEMFEFEKLYAVQVSGSGVVLREVYS